jgi:hypothetical protein
MLFVVRTMRNIQIQSVGRTEAFNTLKHVVCTEPPGFKGNCRSVRPLIQLYVKVTDTDWPIFLQRA